MYSINNSSIAQHYRTKQCAIVGGGVW